MDDPARRDTYRKVTDDDMAQMSDARSKLEKEVADLLDEIDRVQDLDIIVTMSDDGTRVTEEDPQDALPGLIIQLEDTEKRLQRQVAKYAYLLASGG